VFLKVAFGFSSPFEFLFESICPFSESKELFIKTDLSAGEEYRSRPESSFKEEVLKLFPSIISFRLPSAGDHCVDASLEPKMK
jgi:hypothetical protein